jgi:hypothetical protein
MTPTDEASLPLAMLQHPPLTEDEETLRELGRDYGYGTG